MVISALSASKRMFFSLFLSFAVDCQFIARKYCRSFVRKNVSERLNYDESSSTLFRVEMLERHFYHRACSRASLHFPFSGLFLFSLSIFFLQRTIFVTDNSRLKVLHFFYMVIYILTSREIIVYCIFSIFNQFSPTHKLT